MKIIYNNTNYEINESNNSVSVGGVINPDWVVTSSQNPDGSEGNILGIHNTKSNEFISTLGRVSYVIDENNIKL